MKKVLAIIGARPQFIKHYPFELAAKDNIELITLHTGQHYDENMSQVFFDQLGMSRPDYLLNVGSGSHGTQTAKMMIDIEKICLDLKPDAVMVYGDTNSTLAAAIVASKIHIPVVHIEAGLRSFNKKMPEEINRIMTDHISELLFVPSEKAMEHLAKEGISDGVHEVGDIMKDIVFYVKENKLAVNPNKKSSYYYVTLHRPYNVDIKERLTQILNVLNGLPQKVIFSIHPRTRSKMKTFNMNADDYSNITFIDPQGYLENMGYLENAELLITDSGGMQKEAYWFQKKCLTIRSETEWTETMENGANKLIFEELSEINTSLDKSDIVWNEDLYGNGRASHKMVELIVNYLK